MYTPGQLGRGIDRGIGRQVILGYITKHDLIPTCKPSQMITEDTCLHKLMSTRSIELLASNKMMHSCGKRRASYQRSKRKLAPAV